MNQPSRDETANYGQTLAVQHGTGPLLVLAGPGSGKTFVITRRIRWLIEERGVDPSSILVITFTRAAAGQMRDRFYQLTAPRMYSVNFGTFHSVYYHILKSASLNQGLSILSENEKRDIIKTILLRSSMPVSAGAEEAEQMLAQIGYYKNAGCPGNFCPDEESGLKPEDFFRLYDAYDKCVRAAGKLDFDDMVLRCRRLLMERGDILSGWQKKFRFILVDEFQDINPVQYEVLRMLALPENNLFVVGDDDQSIYGFRGAGPRIMLGFQKDYPDAQKVELSVNYRSTPQIVRAAGRLIVCNRERLPKRAKASRKDGEPVRLLGFRDRAEQNRTLAEELAKVQAREGKEAMNRAAVIYRTNRDGIALAEELTRRGVVFHMKERLISPYRSQAAGDLLAYLSFVFDGHRRGDFLRIMNRPQRYLSREAFQEPEVCFSRLKEYYGNCSYMLPVLERLERDLQRLEGMDLYAAVNYIRKGMGYDEYLYEQEMNRSEKGEKNPLREADWFMQQVRGYEELGEFRIHIRRFEKELEEACAGNRQGEGVSLLTMHASKGLEFDRVYLPDCNEGFTPHRKNMGENGMEEERRMFYVAMTRARDRLTLSWVAGTQKEPGIKSRFLEELGM